MEKFHYKDDSFVKNESRFIPDNGKNSELNKFFEKLWNNLKGKTTDKNLSPKQLEVLKIYRKTVTLL